MEFGPSELYVHPLYLRAREYGYGVGRSLSAGSDLGFYPGGIAGVGVDGYGDLADTSEGHCSSLDAIAELPQAKSADSIDGLFGAKREFAGRCVSDIVGLIYEREQLKYDHLRKIVYEACSVETRLLQVHYVRPGINKDIDRLRESIEKELTNFEREKRMEEVACWRDVVRLKTELREAMREWTHEKQKQQLLSDGADAGAK